MKRSASAAKWQRSWDQAISEIADKFIEHASQSGPDSITFAMGTAMIVKRASFAALMRFGNTTGITMPETFAGVGDLPVGAYMTLGHSLPGDNMAAVYKSKCVLIWASNPAATRIPDAHFFWEAKYNGTEVVTIAPDFNATAMHSSKWLNPKPGTDTALALAMVQTIIADGLIEWDYVREQTDLPFLVRTDNGKFLRAATSGGRVTRPSPSTLGRKDRPAARRGQGLGAATLPDSRPVRAGLGAGRRWKALEGRRGRHGGSRPFFESARSTPLHPGAAQAITGVHARRVWRSFARSGAGMIYAGYRSANGCTATSCTAPGC
jgi:anaerobic selenocysteine-containing dehydrogenase